MNLRPLRTACKSQDQRKAWTCYYLSPLIFSKYLIVNNLEARGFEPLFRHSLSRDVRRCPVREDSPAIGKRWIASDGHGCYVQVAAQRVGESYLDTWSSSGRDPAGDQSCREFQNDAPGIFRGEQEGTVPGQEDLRREDDSGRTRFILAIAEADLRTLRASQRRAKIYEAESVEEYLPSCRSQAAR